MSGKPELKKVVSIKRVPSVKVISKPAPKPAPKPVVVKRVKKPRPTPAHHKFWTRTGNWKKSEAWLKHCEEQKKKEQPKKK